MLIEKNKWKGRTASTYKGPVEKILEWIPFFTRTSGWSLVDEGLNEHLDVIIRQPLESDAKYIKDRVRIPVCTVSKQYDLFQHQDVFKALVSVLKRIDSEKIIDSDSDSLGITLVITEYGERMWIRFTLANCELSEDEAERYPMLLEVSGLNTVVPGTALDIRLSWYEPMSEARIPYGLLSAHKVNKVNLKKIARKKAKAPGAPIFSEVYLFLKKHLEQLSRERESYKDWIKAKVSREALTRWIDMTVQKKWKYEDAVRAYHLIINGWDVEVRRSENNDKEQEGNSRETSPNPSKLTSNPAESLYFIKKDGVPKKFFVPAKNAFHVSLVLASIVRQQGTIPDRLRWTDIPELMDALIVEDEQLRRIIR